MRKIAHLCDWSFLDVEGNYREWTQLLPHAAALRRLHISSVLVCAIDEGYGTLSLISVNVDVENSLKQSILEAGGYGGAYLDKCSA